MSLSDLMSLVLLNMIVTQLPLPPKAMAYVFVVCTDVFS